MRLLLILLTLVGLALPLPRPAVAQGLEYSNSDLLADVEWLSGRLGDPSLRLVDMSPASQYTAGHIPGAINLEWERLRLVDTADASIDAWRREVEAILGGLGIAPEHTVVVYDEGSLYSARLFWALEQLGHPSVKVLNGGLPAWQVDGRPLTTDVPAYDPVAYVGSPRPELVAGWTEVLGKLGRQDVALVDVRSPAEFVGQDLRAARGGHIPGAVNVPFTDNALSIPPKYFKSAAELQAMYSALGVTPNKQVITYCSSGVRASVGYLALRLLGYPNLKVYTGSWDEWGNRPDLPIR